MRVFVVGVFDACRAERTLQHLADPDKAVAEMTRVLRPGGRIALTEPDWGTLVVEGSDPEVSSAILAAHVRRHPHPGMGRRLPGLLHAHGIAEIELGSQVVMFTDLESARRAFGIARDLSEIVATGIVGEDQADRWIKDLERADPEHQFFCAVTGFRAAGCKRSDAASR